MSAEAASILRARLRRLGERLLVTGIHLCRVEGRSVKCRERAGPKRLTIRLLEAHSHVSSLIPAARARARESQ